MEAIRITDNRDNAIVARGEVSSIDYWSDSLLIILDTGFTIHIENRIIETIIKEKVLG